MSLNQSMFGSVCEANVLSTVKPSRATRMPDRSARLSDQVPYFFSARSQVAGVPGMPADSPL
jgi:hypothetical protein